MQTNAWLDYYDLNPVTIFTSIKTSQTFLDLQFSGVRVKVMVFKTTFQQYFSYIMVVSFVGRGNGVPGDNHWQTLSHNVVLSTPRHELDSKSQR